MSFLDRITDTRLLELYAYWSSKREDGALPTRSAFDPIDIPQILSMLVLADVIDGGERFRFRLVGTDMVTYWGDDFTGRYLDEIMSGDYGAFITGLFRDVVHHRSAVWSASVFRWDQSRSLNTERLFLPFTEDGETVSAILIGQVFGSPGEKPLDPAWQRDSAFAVEETGRVIENAS